MDQALLALHGGSLETSLTVPLMFIIYLLFNRHFGLLFLLYLALERDHFELFSFVFARHAFNLVLSYIENIANNNLL